VCIQDHEGFTCQGLAYLPVHVMQIGLFVLLQRVALRACRLLGHMIFSHHGFQMLPCRFLSCFSIEGFFSKISSGACWQGAEAVGPILDDSR